MPPHSCLHSFPQNTPQTSINYIISFFIILLLMEILRQEGVYALVYNPHSENESLRYHVDNGEDVSEYFDEYEANDLLNSDSFIKDCKAYL